MSANNSYETMVVFSVANGEEAAQPAPSYSNADEGDFKEIPEDDLPF